MFTQLRDNNRVFTGMFGRFGFSLHIGHAGRTERVLGELVTGTYFPVLGIQPAAGRLFTAEEDRFVAAWIARRAPLAHGVTLALVQTVAFGWALTRPELRGTTPG
jgi:hypothetical protein